MQAWLVGATQVAIATLLLHDQLPKVLSMSSDTNSWAFGAGVALLIDLVVQCVKALRARRKKPSSPSGKNESGNIDPDP